MENDQTHSSLEELGAKREKYRISTQTLAKLLGIVSYLLAFVSISALIWGTFFSSESPLERLPGLEIQLLRDIDGLKAQNSVLQNRITDLTAVVDAISTPDTETELARQVSGLRRSIEIVDDELAAINAAILDNPTKALSIPMLRRDLGDLRDNLDAGRVATSKEIDRIYDQNKWFIGLMFTMAISVIGLAISNFIQSKKRPDADAK